MKSIHLAIPIGASALVLAIVLVLSLDANLQGPIGSQLRSWSAQWSSSLANKNEPLNRTSSSQSIGVFQLPSTSVNLEKQIFVPASNRIARNDKSIGMIPELVSNPANDPMIQNHAVTPAGSPVPRISPNDDKSTQYTALIKDEQSSANSKFQDGQSIESSAQSKRPSLFDLVAQSFELSAAESQNQDLPSIKPSSKPLAPSDSASPQPEFAQTIDLGDVPAQILTPMPSEPIIPLPRSDAQTESKIDEGIQPPAVTESTHPSEIEETNGVVNDGHGLAKSPWVEPRWLKSRLTELSQFESTREWAQTTFEILEALQYTRSLDDPEATRIFGQLQQQVDLTEGLFPNGVTPGEEYSVTCLLRARYDLIQSIAVWQKVVAFANKAQDRIVISDEPAVNPFRQISFAKSGLLNLEPKWQEYLFLDRLQSAIANSEASESSRIRAARATLARLSSPVLSKSQSEFLDENVPIQFIDQLRSMATEDSKIEDLLVGLEEFRNTKSGYHASIINREYQNLLWQSSPEARELASEIDTHFRNANFRMSISDRMLNSLLPAGQEMNEPVNEQLLGADVRGQSRIANRLQVRLIPDASRIHMRLESIGLVRSSTEASKSGVTVKNEGNTRFQVFKRFMIGQQGIESDKPQAVSNSQNQVVGIGSNLDPIPVLGWIARRMAERQIEAQQPVAKQIVQQKVESTVKQRFSEEVDNQLAQMQAYLYSNLIEPLTVLELEPTPVEMRSTADRMIMRYRLAGRDQLAAHTTRPAGLDNSLMSIQIHESAINNLLNRLELNGNRFTVDELQTHLTHVLGIEPNQSAVKKESVDANLEFGPHDPIRVSFEDDQILIEFNLKRLQVGKGKIWKNLTASAKYRYEIRGTQLALMQNEEGVKLVGQRLGARDQIAIRGIFTAIYQNDYSMNLLPQTIIEKMREPLAVTQFDVFDGWIGLSLDTVNAASPAVTAESTHQSGVRVIHRK